MQATPELNGMSQAYLSMTSPTVRGKGNLSSSPSAKRKESHGSENPPGSKRFKVLSDLEMTGLLAKKERFEKEIQSSKQANPTSFAELNRLKLLEMRHFYQVTKDVLSGKEATLEKERVEAAEMRSQLSTEKARAKSLVRELEETKEKDRSLEKELEEERRKNKKLQELEVKVGQFETEVRDQETKFSVKEKKMSVYLQEMTKKIEFLNRVLEEEQQKVSKLESELKAEKEQKGQLKRKFDELEKEKRSVDIRVTELNTMNVDKQKLIDTIEKALEGGKKKPSAQFDRAE